MPRSQGEQQRSTHMEGDGQESARHSRIGYYPEPLPVTAASPLSARRALQVVAHPSTPQQGTTGESSSSDHQEGQGDDFASPVVNSATWGAAPPGTPGDVHLHHSIEMDTVVAETPTQDTTQSTALSPPTDEARTVARGATQRSDRSDPSSTQSAVTQPTPVASQESAYDNMFIDAEVEHHARALEVLLSQAGPQHQHPESTPLHRGGASPMQGPALPRPAAHKRVSAPSNVLSQRDPNTTPLHVQLARVAEPQTCSQAAPAHAENLEDLLQYAGGNPDDEEDGGRVLFGSPGADVLASLHQEDSNTPAPLLRRRPPQRAAQPEQLTQVDEDCSSPTPKAAAGTKRARSSAAPTERDSSPAPVSTTQRTREESAEWSRLARQFFEFIDSRPDLSTIELPRH